MNEATKNTLRRLVACLFGGFVLALMIGQQEGTLTDFGISFRKAVAVPRIFVFLAIGVLIFLAITFWGLVRPYLRRPGVVPISVGFLVVIVSQTVLTWYDPLKSDTGNGKFNKLRSVVDKSSGLQQTTTWFFDWLAWTLAIGAVVACGAAIVTRIRPLGYVSAAAGVAGAVFAYLSHQDVIDVGGGFDHSFGMYTDVVGFLILAGAGVTAARARAEVADPRGFLTGVMDWRPGLPFAVLGAIMGLLAYTTVCWFAPLTKNDTFADSRRDFKGTGISSLASQYLSWLGWTVFVAAAALAIAATYLVNRLLGWIAVAVSLAGVILTFIAIHSMTNIASAVAPENGGNWKNLGVGGYLMSLVFMVIAAAGLQVASAARTAEDGVALEKRTNELPVTRMVNQARRSARSRALVVIVLGIALFYPPMLDPQWQTTLVVNIGVFVLLALGLNVVVGWAGLLDLGYIAFYEIGAYTTAYFVGALPRKPPSWLELSPLETIPFSIVACLIAGVLLGAPTLRLRGDYLAIVTLGFGEIIQLTALNNPGNLTGGAAGPNIPHPTIHLLGLHITWGQDSLPYWYLLLVMLVVTVVLFYRLEGSRLGRAWAAIREDEVAAQASGVNTVRVKLLAFAIGACTSALAGTFFASQVGYFDPTLFTLQASILIVAYVVFGGMGSLAGAMAGAAVLTWLPQFLKDQVPQADRQMWVGALVLAMMIFRPAGLLPERRRKAELGSIDEAPSGEVMAVPRAGAM